MCGAAAQLGSNLSTPVISNQATAPADVFRVQYFRGLLTGATLSTTGNGFTITGNTSPEEYVDIVNPGTNGADPHSSVTGVGDLCALIYVFDTNEELEECCGCLVTPDQLIEIPVIANLLSNPNNPRLVRNGVIKIISSAPTRLPAAEYDNSVCNPGAPNPTPTLREWITHTRAFAAAIGPPATGATLGVTEEEFSFAPLSTGEQNTLTTVCSGFTPQSTGAGVCSCPTPLL
jgi:hypothetical protein